MFNLRGRQSAVLEVFAGTVDLAKAQDLPEGASFRNQNIDYQVGSFSSRDGLASAFSFSGSSVGPSGAQTAVDTPLPAGLKWTAPTNVLTDDNAYATVNLNTSAESVSDAATVTEVPPTPTPNIGGWDYYQDITSQTSATYAVLGSNVPAGTGTTSSQAGSITQGSSSLQWQSLGALTTNSANAANITLGGSTGGAPTTTAASYNSPSISAQSSSPGQTVTNTSTASTFGSGAVFGNTFTIQFYVTAILALAHGGNGSASVLVSTNGGVSFSTLYSASFDEYAVYQSIVVDADLVNLNNLQIVVRATAVGPQYGTTVCTIALTGLQVVYSPTGTASPTVAPTITAGALGLSIGSGTYESMVVSFDAYAYVTPSFSVQLAVDGSLIGTSVAVTLPSVNGVGLQPVTLTGTQLGIGSLTAFQVNDLQVIMTASGGSASTQSYIKLNALSVVVTYSTPAGTGPTSTAVLTVSSLGLAIPQDDTYASMTVGVRGFYSGTNSGVVATFQLLTQGTAIGKPFFFTLTGSPVSLSLDAEAFFGISTLTALQVANLQVSVSAGCSQASEQCTVYLNSLTIIVAYTGGATSDALDIKQFGFNLPSSSTPGGFLLSIAGYAPSTATVDVELLKAGQPVGNIRSIALATAHSTVTLGSMNDLFGAGWTYSDLNGTQFGMRITANGEGIVGIGYATIEAYYAPGRNNFDFVGTYEDSFGDIYTLALDAAGQFWIENVNVTPGELTSLFLGPPANSFVSGFNADSRFYMAISDGKQGNYPPQQYTGTYNDRISQVGPGASPNFTGTLSSGSAVSITAYSTSSGIVTLTGTNSLSAGEVVTFSITAGPTFLNGLQRSVLGTGLSGTAFEVAYAGASGSGTATGTAAPQYSYPIAASPNGITQYPAYPVPGSAGSGGGFDEVTLSSGPGSLNSGNVATFYYAVSGQDSTLVNAFNAGKFPVYVYISGCAIGNGTQLVTSVGLGTPPGLDHERFYFTVNLPTTGGQKFGNPSPGTYQMTVASLTTLLPLPGVQLGDQISMSGNGVTSWNNSFGIVQTLNAGEYTISQTAMTGGVATYTFSLAGTTVAAPVVGDLVTVTNTLNGDGVFNVTDALVSAVTSTTFNVAGFAGNLTYPLVTDEEGQAVTFGTSFQIDPGPATLGTTTNPIYGSSGGGFITLVGSTSIVIQPGTRRGVVFFITRNGYYTAPSPYIQFSTVANTNYILASNIPIGPPNVVARGIAFTEAGSNNVPGASYYTIPTPQQFVLNGVTYLSSSLFINDNTTTAAKFTFTDNVLLNAEEIDIQGANLFNQVELQECAWMVQYANRMFAGRVRNQVTNFVNLSFDGGYNPNPGNNLAPLGWALDPNFGSQASVNLLVSPLGGNSFYILNQTGNTQSAYGMITQSAYEDQDLVPIIQTNTLYSVRVTCRTPSGATGGSLVVDLTSEPQPGVYGSTYGSYQLNLSQMSTTMATYQGTLLVNAFTTVPSNLLLRIYAVELPNDADIEVDRFQVFPSIEPTQLTDVYVSYKDDLEAFDIDNVLPTATFNAQPVNGAAIIHDQLYIFKESSLGYFSETPNQEPANWNPYKEVSNIAGACGIFAYDVGEEWAIMACQNGLYGFNGGAPMPMMLEIPNQWQAINWAAASTIVVRNDTQNRRILVAVPMATPNQWLPYAATNANPTSPNVILMCNYAGIGTFEELMSSMTVHVTMMGKLSVHDLRRKWSIWTIPTPYLAQVKRGELNSEMLFCNGIGSSKIYALSDTATMDDGQPIPACYVTYPFIDAAKAQENPMFGMHNKRFAYVDFLIEGEGTVQARFFQNSMSAPYPYTIPGGIALDGDAVNDMEFPLDEYGMRLFIEISANAVPTLLTSAGANFTVSRITLVGAADKFAPVRGK